MWKTFEEIGTKEGRLDVCVTGHGVTSLGKSSLDYTADEIDHVSDQVSSRYFVSSDIWQVMDVNFKGALYSAQGAAKQMIRFGNGGSIVLMASMAGKVAFKVRTFSKNSGMKYIDVRDS